MPYSNYSLTNKTIALSIGVIMMVFLIGFFALAWTEPSQAPPGGNVSAPLNTSEIGQSKLGGLILNTSASPAVVGLSVAQGKVGIGTTNPMQALDLRGNLVVTEGSVNSEGYEVEGTPGYNGNITVKGSDSENCTITIMSGIITSTTCP